MGLEVMDADLQAVVQDERKRRQTSRPPRPHLIDVVQGTTAQQIEAEARAREQRVAAIVARAAESKAEAGPPELRAVDAALTAWQQAQTDAARSRAVQDWMRSMERIEQAGGDVAAANAHSRKALGGRYAGFMREVGGLARLRSRPDLGR